ncbi:hypothetical protein ACXHQ0_19530 [Vibrio antiquarius]|uniref:Uncharacterized protein n=1 Tax=Vibrio parahaemolyticus TaxID=670 RepID=A0A8H9N9V8_VIBPH|nr:MULTISPECIES: hypothetical protein [Vibrio harveyi group]EGR3229855.1 hypothetical protein [Vibrio parahaemolyticus]EGR5927988.1 hypothetical protein [Vibrio parahaemolyticus]KOY37950.1 hypothetical protein ACX10_11935 [Vibrio parahaemolyticus]MCS0114756.1 hypothetical protein [Vibrio parahaemolyticus]MCS0314051.1 hypothetical protein [Vibrio diabolicus]
MLDNRTKIENFLMDEGYSKWTWYQIQHPNSKPSFIMKVGDRDYVYTVLDENYSICTTGIGKVWFQTDNPDLTLKKLRSYYKTLLS